MNLGASDEAFFVMMSSLIKMTVAPAITATKKNIQGYDIDVQHKMELRSERKQIFSYRGK